MPNVIDLREQAYAKFKEAAALQDAHGNVSAADEARFNALVDEGKALDDQAIAAAGRPADGSLDPRAYLDAYLDASGRGPLGQAVAGGAAGMVFGRGGGHQGAPGSLAASLAFLGPSWTDAIVDSGHYRASILDPSGTVPVAVPLRSEVVVDARRARFVAELIRTEDAPGGRFSWLRQTARANNAAAVAKLALKPESVFTFGRNDDRTRTLAHVTGPIARQDLSDAPVLRQVIDDELRHGVALELDRQILAADGTGEDMIGILEAGIVTQAFDTDILTTTMRAWGALQSVDEEPTAWMFNPLDWVETQLELLDREVSQAGPNGRAPLELHGLPVLVTNGMPAGRALLGDFARGVILYRTGPIEVRWAQETFDPDFTEGEVTGASDFRRNAVRALGEGRFGVAVLRPFGFIEVDLAAGGS